MVQCTTMPTALTKVEFKCHIQLRTTLTVFHLHCADNARAQNLTGGVMNEIEENHRESLRGPWLSCLPSQGAPLGCPSSGLRQAFADG